jgi:hypothetical protein
MIIKVIINKNGDYKSSHDFFYSILGYRIAFNRFLKSLLLFLGGINCHIIGIMVFFALFK